METTIAELEMLRQENKELRAKVERLEKRVEELLAIINKNSGNSGKPPSSDGLKKIKNSREKSGRSVGGQI